MRTAKSVYTTIAEDIARRIVSGEFPVGSKISGRTILSSQYAVSPETVRKAVCILRDANIVEVSQGKEILVTSEGHACRFVEHQKSLAGSFSLHEELETILSKKQQLDSQFENIINQIMQYSDKLKRTNLINQVEFTIPRESHLIGKTLATIDLWRYTKATVVAIGRGTEIIVSPGPDAVLEANDRLVVVGSQNVLDRVASYVTLRTELKSEFGSGGSMNCSLKTICALIGVSLASQNYIANYIFDMACSLESNLLLMVSDFLLS